jgi:hypothetical protein
MEFDVKKLKPAQLKRVRSLANLSLDQLARFLSFVDFVQFAQNGWRDECGS